MKYKYYPLNARPFGSTRVKTIWRPIIEAIFIKNKIYISHHILLDSGADVNLFRSEVAEALGIKINSGKKKKAKGIGDTPIKGYEHSFNIRIPGLRAVKTKAIFTNDLPDYAVSIAGNLGFFDKFKVSFDYKRKEIEVI